MRFEGNAGGRYLSGRKDMKHGAHWVKHELEIFQTVFTGVILVLGPQLAMKPVQFRFQKG